MLFAICNSKLNICLYYIRCYYFLVVKLKLFMSIFEVDKYRILDVACWTQIKLVL